MGGPYWAAKDERAWSIPKGEYAGRRGTVGRRPPRVRRGDRPPACRTVRGSTWARSASAAARSSRRTRWRAISTRTPCSATPSRWSGRRSSGRIAGLPGDRPGRLVQRRPTPAASCCEPGRAGRPAGAASRRSAGGLTPAGGLCNRPRLGLLGAWTRPRRAPARRTSQVVPEEAPWPHPPSRRRAHPKGSPTGAPATHVVEVSRTIAAPPDQVWQLMTSPHRRGRPARRRRGARRQGRALAHSRTDRTGWSAATTRSSSSGSPGTPTTTRRPAWSRWTCGPTATAPSSSCGTSGSTTAASIDLRQHWSAAVDRLAERRRLAG